MFGLGRAKKPEPEKKKRSHDLTQVKRIRTQRLCDVTHARQVKVIDN